jgi:uncharacterized membrane protein
MQRASPSPAPKPTAARWLRWRRRPVQRMYHGIDHGLFHPGAAQAASGVPLVLAWAGCAPRRAWTR